MLVAMKSPFLSLAIVAAISLQFAAADQSSQELDIQAKLVRVTGWLVLVGLLQVVALIIQAIVFWGTLDTMRDSSHRQLRAYVLPEQSGILDGTMLNPPQPARANVPGCGMLIKNSGQTPAYKVVSFAQIAILPVNSPSTQFIVPPIPTRFFNTIGVGGTFSKSLWFDRALTAGEITDIANGVQAIFLFGRIEYEDIFKKHHVSNFRLHYTWGQFPPPIGAIFSFSEEGNDAT